MHAVIRRIGRSATLALLLSPVGLLLISATRLLIVSYYNPATALAILSSGGYINTLLGTIMPMVPIFMPYLALLLLFFNRVIPSILAFFAAALISPTAISGSAFAMAGRDWHLIFTGSGMRNAVMIILAIPFALFLLTELAGFELTVFIRTVGTVATIAFLPLILQLYPLPVNNSFYADLVRQPWLPAETFTLTSHQKVTGYSLASSGSWFEVLLDDNRTIRYYPASDIANQQVCLIQEATRGQPLIKLAPAHTTVPPCMPPSPISRNVLAHWPPPIFKTQPAAGSTEVPVQYLFPQYARQSIGR